MNDLNNTKCSAKAVWLSIYFILHVIGFTSLLLAVVSPSWQFVYLEEGRTEHHHGLWMDCKRDYSNEYGRPREFYEKLFRLDHMQGPFDQFSLPSLQCVYKFDYWLDDEDWYEHGYDENRLQDDAYQHLWLGWKIAALTALLLSLIFTLCALITCVCGFCHRLLVCVSAVLSTIGVLTSIIGNTIFFMYARYQDNNIIKQDEGIYEQYFGWSFYTSLLANGFLFFAAVVGCIATSVTVSSGKAKLVKIEVEDNDSLQLLSSGTSSQPFKRSYSAVYKIDSIALRKWEKEAMKSFRKNNFKRANSMPNIKKGNQRPLQTSSYMHSNSDISKAFTDPAHFTAGPMQRESLALSEAHLADYTGMIPTGGSAFPAHASDPVYPPPVQHIPDDVVYEYVEHNSISLSSTLGKNQNTLPVKNSTSLNYYDKVPSSAPSVASTSKIHFFDDNEYLRPKTTKQSTTIPAYSEPSKKRYVYEKNLYEETADEKTTTSFGANLKHRRTPSEDFTKHSEILQSNMKSTLITPISNFPSKMKPPELPAKPSFLSSGKISSISSKSSTKENENILINTFDDETIRATGQNRSLTSLHSIILPNPVSVFDRSETATPLSPASSHETYSSDARPISSKLLHSVLRNEAANVAGMKETSLDWPKLPRNQSSRNGSITSTTSFNCSLLGQNYASSEMDRSIGASTIVAPNSPSQQMYEVDTESEKSMTSKAGSNNGETFV